jgi:RHS repeat-associated protein
MVTKTKTSANPNEVTEYEYYVGGNLKQVTLPDTSEITYLYDAYGNRIQKATPEEVITYQYAMGSLRREIHKDDTNTTTLYTLNYYPWGLDKVIPAQGENPEVVTPYYYIYDQKGFVQAIMDNNGDIVETYEYSPFGELLTTPTITQFRFLSGREECIWDPEINLYYMHARYYDPILGRFQTQDSMRGSMGSPVSLNRYTYCQNDPISLADPSGNSPFNTGLPSRPSEPGDQLTVDLQAACNSEVNRGDESDFSVQNDACNMTYIIHVDAVSGNGSFQITLPNGVVVEITVNLGAGSIFFLNWKTLTIKVISGRTDNNAHQTDEFIAGLRAGLMTLIRDGATLTDLIVTGNNISCLTMKEFNDFVEHAGNKIKTDKFQDSDEYRFMFHATIGCFIASKMYNFYPGDPEEQKVNREIGFWVSYYAEKAKKYFKSVDIPLKTTIFTSSGQIGLIEIANLVKCLAHAEHGYGEVKDSRGIYGTGNGPDFDFLNVETAWGYLQNDSFGSDFFAGMDFHGAAFRGYANRFTNISIAVGDLFASMILTHGTKAYEKPLNMYDWLRAARRYNGNTKDAGTETYIHSFKFRPLLEALYGKSWFNFLHGSEIDKFEQYVKDGAKDEKIEN